MLCDGAGWGPDGFLGPVPGFENPAPDTNRFFGGAGKDMLFGGSGSDYLDGGRDGERDELEGVGGADVFVRDDVWRPLGNSGFFYNEDVPQDFEPGSGDTFVSRPLVIGTV